MENELQKFAWNMDARDYFRFVQFFQNPITHTHDRKCCRNSIIYSGSNERILYFYSGSDGGWQVARALEDNISITSIVTDPHMAKIGRLLLKLRKLPYMSIRPFKYEKISEDIDLIIIGSMAYVRYEIDRLQDFFDLISSYNVPIITGDSALKDLYKEYSGREYSNIKDRKNTFYRFVSGDVK